MSLPSREIVSRAIEFRRPPRLPVWQHEDPAVPDDVCDIWEMDRAQAGWFCYHPGIDDGGCGWERTEMHNMSQVTSPPLADWSALKAYRPPDPRNPFYFDRIDGKLSEA